VIVRVSTVQVTARKVTVRVSVALMIDQVMTALGSIVQKIAQMVTVLGSTVRRVAQMVTVLGSTVQKIARKVIVLGSTVRRVAQMAISPALIGKVEVVRSVQLTGMATSPVLTGRAQIVPVLIGKAAIVVMKMTGSVVNVASTNVVIGHVEKVKSALVLPVTGILAEVTASRALSVMAIKENVSLSVGMIVKKATMSVFQKISRPIVVNGA
jgi:prophage DNA circulation protein